MEHKKYSTLSILKIVCGVVSAFWLVMCVPTDLIYNLGVGTETEQGQIPNQSVSVQHTHLHGRTKRSNINCNHFMYHRGEIL